MIESNPTLDIMVDIGNLIRYANKHGFITFYDWEDGGVLLRKEDFLRFFPEHDVEEYTGSNLKPAHRGVAYYDGQRFYTLLDYEVPGEEDE